MHSVNQYNCNGLIDLLRLLEKMLLKLEADEQNDYKELQDLLQRVHDELTTNFKDYITSLEAVNTLILTKIKPVVQKLDEKTLTYLNTFKDVAEYYEILDSFLKTVVIFRLDHIFQLIEGGDNDDDVSQSITKRLSDGFEKIEKENTKHHNNMNTLVDKHAEDVMDYDNKSANRILDKLVKHLY